MVVRPLIATVAVVLLLAGCGGSSSNATSGSQSSSSATQTTTSQQIGFEGVPIEQGPDLGSPGTTGTQPVDGIQCGATEQLAYHIHVHLSVYADGSPRALPGGIGIPGSAIAQTAQGPVANGGRCIYWLHTHAPDGIIHVESPTHRIYTLGEFFDEWHQPLTSTQVAGASGRATAFVNGNPWTKSLRSIPLVPHAVIQLSVGPPVVPFHGMSWSGLQL